MITFSYMYAADTEAGGYCAVDTSIEPRVERPVGNYVERGTWSSGQGVGQVHTDVTKKPRSVVTHNSHTVRAGVFNIKKSPIHQSIPMYSRFFPTIHTPNSSNSI